MKKGFTLVELSIVLVIIGLLIGGILVGQSLIESAKLNNFVRNIGQYESAVALFKGKFRYLPGDSNLCLAGTCRGDRDGFIEQDADTDNFDGNEMDAFWAELVVNGLKNRSATVNNYDTYKVPKSPFRDDSMIFAFGGDIDYFGTGQTGNVFIVADPVSNIVGSSDNWYPSLKGIEALSIDTKLDNGNGTSGNIMNWYDSGGNGFTDIQGAYLDSTVLPFNNSDYLPNQDELTSILFIRFGTAGIKY